MNSIYQNPSISESTQFKSKLIKGQLYVIYIYICKRNTEKITQKRIMSTLQDEGRRPRVDGERLRIYHVSSFEFFILCYSKT